MANSLIKSTVLVGEEERTTRDRPRATNDGRTPTLKDLIASQTIPLFTISYELVTKSKRPRTR